MSRYGDWIQTYGGGKFYPLDPRPGEILIGDIAHALALQCRFAGHVRDFYSVAQHSVLASTRVPAQDALWALLHDAAEAYLCDVPRPVKIDPGFAFYKAAEARLEQAIAARFGLSDRMPASVKEADDRMLATERRDLLSPGPAWTRISDPYPERLVPWAPAVAEAAFLGRFAELGGAP